MTEEVKAYDQTFAADELVNVGYGDNEKMMLEGNHPEYLQRKINRSRSPTAPSIMNTIIPPQASFAERYTSRLLQQKKDLINNSRKQEINARELF